MVDEDPFAAIPDRGSAPDWMQITIRVPMDDGLDIVRCLRNAYGFRDVDWCIMGRDNDNSRVDYDPCEPLTEKPPN